MKKQYTLAILLAAGMLWMYGCGSSCETNAECGDGLVCKGGTCVESGCKTSLDCDAGYKCSDGECVEKNNASVNCTLDSDCMGGTCVNGKCTFDCTEVPVAGSLVINEIMSGPKADTNCDGQFVEKDDEFVEIFNASNVPLQLRDLELTSNGATKHTFGSMCLPAQRAVVVYGGGTPNCAMGESIAVVTEKGMSLPAKPTIGLSLNGVELTKVDTSNITSSSGYSLVRYPDITGSDIFVSYENVPGILASDYSTPGLCLLKDMFDNDGCTIPTGDASCNDNITNNGETDVDCGGPNCGACSNGKKCLSGSDCSSNNCNNGYCIAAGGACSGVPAAKGELLINEIFTRDSAETSFDGLPGIAQNDFIEFVNVSDHDIDMKDIQIYLHKAHILDSTERDWSQKKELHSFTDSVCVKAGSGIVLYAKDQFALNNTSDVVEMKLGKSESITADDIGITVIRGDEELIRMEILKGEGSSKTQVSLQRNPDFTGADNSFTDHNVVNQGGLKHSPARCASGEPLSKGCSSVTVCFNGKLDNGELDVDCGGTCSAKCGDGKKCTQDSDCLSNKCKPDGKCDVFVCKSNEECGDNGICFEDACVSCTDGVQNGDETDKDCGGSCSPCTVGQKCGVNTDCDTNECKGGVCTGNKPDVADLTKLVINEVMGSPQSSGFFAIQSTTNQCEFVEIVNLDTKPVSLDGIQLKLQKDGSTTADKTIELSGIIPANGVFVVSEKEIPMPKDAMNMVKSIAISNDKAYTIWLEKDGVTHSSITRAALKTGDGKSQNRNPDLGDNAVLEWHNNVSTEKLLNSPGYCSNGGLFSEGCKIEDTCNNNQQDGDESDVDCGGFKCSKCENNKACNSEEDCQSGQCSNDGICIGNAVDAAELTKLSVNEVMGSPKTSIKFAIQTETTQCEFVEILNLDSKDVSVDGIQLKLQKEGSSTADKTIDLKGIVPAKGVLVVSEKEIPMPSDGKNMVNQIGITNDKVYTIWLEKGGVTHSSVTRMGLKTGNGKSQNRKPDRDTSNAALDWHDSVSTEQLLNSPGYCVNGKLFSNDCK